MRKQPLQAALTGGSGLSLMLMTVGADGAALAAACGGVTPTTTALAPSKLASTVTVLAPVVGPVASPMVVITDPADLLRSIHLVIKRTETYVRV